MADGESESLGGGATADSSHVVIPLDQVASLPSNQAAELFARAYDGASDPRQRIQIDADLLRLLGDRHLGDALLGGIDVELLEGLSERLTRQLAEDADGAQERAWQMLDVARRSALLRRIADEGRTDRWAELILQLVERSQFTFARLFEQRAHALGSRPLFLVPRTDGDHPLFWHQVSGRVDLMARGLLAMTSGTGQPRIAILSENRLDMALCDLACLASGIVNVMIPATSTEHDVAYILDHAKVNAVVVSTRQQLRKVQHAAAQVDTLRTIIAFDPEAVAHQGVSPFEEVLSRAGEVSPDTLAERRRRLQIDDLATVMYTSGTTGTPKGICFSHRNIVFKRFARALALPEIGENDRFLCYLPLYHTFGRFLEMTGCVFWGATYCFATSPTIDELTRQMARIQPTVFISIPLKWTQLYDAVGTEVNLETATEAEVSAAVHRVTGGKLRWGLSAAGYLDPEVFRFYQRHGIELMSGFGMTEATGGITMTPPGRYRDDSLGCALPGIELMLADDGELKVRGPYVAMGYLDPPKGETSFDEDGWLPTGDLMESEPDGFLRIIDRKKEIYKNVKGQTIAPQKIENQFREFDSVARVFLVGDHRPFNTALIYPDQDLLKTDLAELPPEDLKAHFRSLVVSANTFLAPFERIVDFAIIPRDFSADRGELTPKGTYKRKNIERNFADTIRPLYRRTTLRVGGAEVIFPNWLFQALGITTQEVHVDGDNLVLPSFGTSLTVSAMPGGQIDIGSARYQVDKYPVDLGLLVSTPRLWLGNEELCEFAPLNEVQRDRQRTRSVGVTWLRRPGPYRPTDVERGVAEAILEDTEADLISLHLAALLVSAESRDDAALGLELLEHMERLDRTHLTGYLLLILRRAVASGSPEVVQRAFRQLVEFEEPSHYHTTLVSFIERDPDVLVGVDAVELDLTQDALAAFVDEAERRCSPPQDSDESSAIAHNLLMFLAEYGASHPSRYRQLRAVLTRLSVMNAGSAVGDQAAQARLRVERGFREWIGRSSRVAVDPETGLEYRWDDVIAFSEEVDAEARRRLRDAIANTPMLREGMFLFSGGSVVRLEDILPGGVWIRLLGSDHGKSVYRIVVKTRQHEQLDLAVNLNTGLTPEQIREEIDWLIVCSEARELGPLVEEFGGYWPEHSMWTEEFIPGDTLDRALSRLARRDPDGDWYLNIWPFAAWSALGAYVDFWNRTGRTLVVADPGPSNVIVPMHDYHTGARLVSISARLEFQSLGGLLTTLQEQLIAAIEAEHPRLQGQVGWNVVFASLLEIVGEAEGVALLRPLLDSGAKSVQPDMKDTLVDFLEAVERRGFLPRRLYFSAKRYRRWESLNPEATRSARARTLQELFHTYRLDDIQSTYPDVRPRFYLGTVFRDASQPLARGLQEIVVALRRGELSPDDLSAVVSDLRARLTLDDEADYFLARLSYPYLRPDDVAEYVGTDAGGEHQSEMVVTLEDSDGRPYRIRHAISPKEVARLHRLFLDAKLSVQFRPEHRFLVAVNLRGHLVGGLFYELLPEEHTAHMDKLVVAEAFRRHGIAGAMLDELCNRLRTSGYRSLTTGFFRPQFFYRYGFSVERRYAGLVRTLIDQEDET